jgi:hypothetical protein
MNGGLDRFNLYFVVGLAALLAGCATSKDPNDKLSTLLRVHLEVVPHQIIPKQTIALPRSHPVPIQVESLYLLTEDNVVRARVVNQMGAHAIEIQFDRWAIPLLEHNSSSYQGRRLAIQAQWGPDMEFTRWLAAPKMNRRIIDGLFTFTPDASLEESYQIVAGLNNNAHKTKKQLEW